MSHIATEEEIHTEEKHRFSFEVFNISEEIHKLETQDPKEQPIIIGKSDNINDRVATLCSKLDSGKGVLLAGKSNSINKLISIIEITKTSSTCKVLYQYNKTIQQTSVKNPNYSYSRMSKSQKENLSNELKPKTYVLPILLVYMSPQSLDLSDWTEQCSTKE